MEITLAVPLLPRQVPVLRHAHVPVRALGATQVRGRIRHGWAQYLVQLDPAVLDADRGDPPIADPLRRAVTAI